MNVGRLRDWLVANERVGTIWYAKRLSANDTGQTGSHQVGIYVPKEIMFAFLPATDDRSAINPDAPFDLQVDSHAERATVRGIYYNSRVSTTLPERPKNGRNETRITRLGGTDSILQQGSSTGALAIFVFHPASGACAVWLCDGLVEETEAESLLGPVDPGEHVIWRPGSGAPPSVRSRGSPAACRLSPGKLPSGWIERFPSGSDILDLAIRLRPDIRRTADGRSSPDARLLRRRDCEFELFLSVEAAHYAPRIRDGFESIDSFVATAQSLLQRRKSRAGNSLELHAAAIFREEGLKPDVDFSHRAQSEPGKVPDFLFPSASAYRRSEFPAERLRMLAAKTTCKDRWRQILNEADRIGRKHLLTLQAGVSLGQFAEMRQAGVQLVVPQGLHKSFPKQIQPELQSLAGFVEEVAGLCR